MSDKDANDKKDVKDVKEKKIDNDESFKTYGTVLKGEDKETDRKLTKLSTVTKKFDFQLPETFNGPVIWRNYLSNIYKQGFCGYCWAISTASVTADRFAIYTDNQCNVNLSTYELLSCGFSTVDIDKLNIDDKASKDIVTDNKILYQNVKNKCNGMSVYNALRYMYVYGATSSQCTSIFDINQSNKKKFNNFVEYEKDIPSCEMIFGPNYDTCSDRKKAPRFYRIKLFYMVANNVDQIKYEIYKFGPVIGGFKLYPSFIKEYDGKSIYMGPKEGEEYLGGHAIRVLGWGKEGDTEYWICANSWGSSWGMNGLFRIKMGLKECQLEDNIYGLIPDLPNLKVPDYLDVGFSVTKLNKLRKLIKINNESGYKDSTVTKILKGELAGDLTYLAGEKFQKDLESFMAGEVDEYKTSLFEKSYFPIEDKYLEEESSIDIYFIIFLFSFIVINVFIYYFYIKGKGK